MNHNGGDGGARDSPSSPDSLIFQSAIRSTLRSPFGRTDSILAPASFPKIKKPLI